MVIEETDRDGIGVGVRARSGSPSLARAKSKWRWWCGAGAGSSGRSIEIGSGRAVDAQEGASQERGTGSDVNDVRHDAAARLAQPMLPGSCF